jgi:hypothetical protein
VDEISHGLLRKYLRHLNYADGRNRVGNPTEADSV